MARAGPLCTVTYVYGAFFTKYKLKIRLQNQCFLIGLWLLLIGFFAYCAAEATTMQWASTYFAEVKNIPAEKLAAFAALFYIGITISRFISGFITDKFGDRMMIRGGACIVICGKFRGNNRNTNGKRLCRLNLCTAAFRAYRQFNRLFYNARLPACLHNFNGTYG